MPITNEILAGGATASTSSSNTSIFNTAYAKGRSEILVTKADLESAGFVKNDMFSSIKFYITKKETKNKDGISIGIKHSPITKLVKGEPFGQYSTFTEVASNKSLMTADLVVNTWVEFQFDEPYYWNGIDGLIITIVYNSSYTSGYSSNGEWLVKTIPYGNPKYSSTSGTTNTNGYEFPYDGASPYLYTSDTQVPSMQLTAIDRGPVTHSPFSSITTKAEARGIPVTNSVYGKSSVTSSASASGKPTKIVPPTATPVSTLGLVAYLNSKKGISGNTWSNLAPQHLGKYDATLVGAVLEESGVRVTDTNDYASMPAISTTDLPTNNITIEAWLNVINPGSNFGDKGILSTGFTPSFNYLNQKVGVGYLAKALTDEYSNVLIPNNTLTQVVYRINLALNTWDIIVNGIKFSYKGEDLLSSNIRWSGVPMEIGTYFGQRDYYYQLDAHIPVLRIYNRPLGDDELEQHRLYGTDIGLGGTTHLAESTVTASSESVAVPVVESTVSTNSIVTDGLIGYWNSKQGINGSVWENIAPTTIGQYDATIAGAVLQSEGLSLDGIDDYVSLSPTRTTIGDFTIEFMLKSNTSNFESEINLGLYVEGYGDGAGYLVGTIGDISGNTYLTDKLLGSADNNVGFSLRYISSTGVLEHIYPDGSIVPTLNGTQLRVNSILYQAKSFLNVVRYYDKALTLQEIADNYAVGTDVGLSESEPLVTVKESNMTIQTVSSIDVSPIVVKESSIDTQASSSIDVFSTAIKKSSTALQALSSIDVSSTVVKESSMTLQIVSIIDVSPIVTKESSVALQIASSSMQIEPLVVKQSALSMHTTSTIESIPNLVKMSEVYMNGVLDINMSASSVKNSVSFIDSMSILDSDSTKILRSTLSTQSVSSMLVNSETIEVTGSGVRIDIESSMMCSGTSIKGSVVSIESSALLETSANRVVSSVTSLVSRINMDSDIIVLVNGACSISSDTNTSVIGSSVKTSLFSVLGTSNISSDSAVIRSNRVTMSSISDIDITAIKILGSESDMFTDSALESSSTKILNPKANLTISDIMESVGNAIIDSPSVSSTSISSLIVQVNITRTPGLDLTGTLTYGVEVTALMVTDPIEIIANQKEEIDIILRGVMK